MKITFDTQKEHENKNERGTENLQPTKHEF